MQRKRGHERTSKADILTAALLRLWPKNNWLVLILQHMCKKIDIFRGKDAVAESENVAFPRGRSGVRIPAKLN